MKQQTRVEILTPPIIERYLGEKPPFSVKGIAIMDNDKPVCIACVSQFVFPMFVMFDCLPEIKTMQFKRNIIEGWKIIKPYLSGTVLAQQDKEKPTSDSMLRHFGFEPLDDEFYIYRGD